ncbi:MAG TPA: TrkA C-terminal domain-containing protein [Deltaproteobacteria bacterium]|nr:TrkA C-terminal domain-containing protein [Deltaproteobacteria bacterium]
MGIRRGDEYVISPGPDERVLAGDTLLVLGTADALERLGLGFERAAGDSAGA